VEFRDETFNTKSPCVETFQKRYQMSLTQLEDGIKTEGVSTEKHEIREDSIEWRNATEEAAK